MPYLADDSTHRAVLRLKHTVILIIDGCYPVAVLTEDDILHPSRRRIRLIVDDAGDGQPIEIRLRITVTRLLLFGQVTHQHAVDLRLEEIPALRRPYLRLTEYFLPIPLPIVTVFSRRELIGVRRIAPVEDAAQLVETHRQHLVCLHREAEQRAEHLKLVMRQQILHKRHEVRQGLTHALTACQHRICLTPCVTVSVPCRKGRCRRNRLGVKPQTVLMQQGQADSPIPYPFARLPSYLF